MTSDQATQLLQYLEVITEGLFFGLGLLTAQVLYIWKK